MPSRPRVAGSRTRSASPSPEPAPPQGAPAPAVSDPAPLRVDDTAPLRDDGDTELIVVGRIGRPQGIKGEVTVEVRTDDPDDRFAPGRVLRTDNGPLTVEGSRMQGKYLVVAFKDVHDRNQAELLRDTILSIPLAELPPIADEDEYYDTQLIGLAAQHQDGRRIGDVTDVLHLPGGDVLVVRRDHGTEALIPFVKAIVPTVDLTTGTLEVDPPEGLLELSDVPEEA